MFFHLGLDLPADGEHIVYIVQKQVGKLQNLFRTLIQDDVAVVIHRAAEVDGGIEAENEQRVIVPHDLVADILGHIALVFPGGVVGKDIPHLGDEFLLFGLHLLHGWSVAIQNRRLDGDPRIAPEPVIGAQIHHPHHVSQHRDGLQHLGQSGRTVQKEQDQKQPTAHRRDPADVPRLDGGVQHHHPKAKDTFGILTLEHTVVFPGHRRDVFQALPMAFPVLCDGEAVFTDLHRLSAGVFHMEGEPPAGGLGQGQLQLDPPSVLRGGLTGVDGVFQGVGQHHAEIQLLYGKFTGQGHLRLQDAAGLLCLGHVGGEHRVYRGVSAPAPGLDLGELTLPVGDVGQRGVGLPLLEQGGQRQHMVAGIMAVAPAQLQLFLEQGVVLLERLHLRPGLTGPRLRRQRGHQPSQRPEVCQRGEDQQQKDDGGGGAV